ncbi:hypothetical protein BDV26DRAFT_265687 [Aspergillus bertholletiae]|uniref:Uncharacterized protein n=1 Tax=Aspergillus bertholletiae TaxID=1226010 RepID=A0A5N7B581_9EURO|nr:hypothetical protein BDV26DRAFT_265687 [Aspergillus bertholletiae]
MIEIHEFSSFFLFFPFCFFFFYYFFFPFYSLKKNLVYFVLTVYLQCELPHKSTEHIEVKVSVPWRYDPSPRHIGTFPISGTMECPSLSHLVKTIDSWQKYSAI